jgi:2-polyprenyl-3-methyl-5-hydroxy-6-metoxy-1,4-benzoquinol methylase
MYEGSPAPSQGHPFRQSLELGLEACLDNSQAGQTWLDVGCGPGHLAARLADRGLRVVALDADRSMIELAQRRLRRGGSSGMVTLVQGDVGALPLATSSIDGAVATSLVGCLSDLSAFIRELRRVLRPGGSLVMTATNRSSVLLRINAALGRIGRHLTGTPADTFRYRLYTPCEIVDALRAADLRPEALRLYNYVVSVGPALLPPAALAVRLRRDLPPDGRTAWMARNFLVVARRA